MRSIILLAATSMAALTVPASAQVGGGAGVGVDVNVGVNPATVVGSATQTVDSTVRQADRVVNRTLDKSRFSSVTRAQVSTGLLVRDSSGKRIGTVASVQGDNAIVVDGRRSYEVPLSELYTKVRSKTQDLTTSIPRAQLAARANAGADTSAGN